MHVAKIYILETLISFQLIDNGKLPSYSHYPSINQYEENESNYDLIGFSGSSVIKDTIVKHSQIYTCILQFSQSTEAFVVLIEKDDNFCGTKQCALSERVSKYNREVKK